MARKKDRNAATFEDGDTASIRKFLFRLFEKGYDPDDALKALKVRLRVDGAKAVRASRPKPTLDAAAPREPQQPETRAARTPKIRP